MKISIREAIVNDHKEIYKLNVEEMGYEYEYMKSLNRFKYILEKDDHKVYVAEAHKQVIGYIHSNNHELIYSEPLKNIMGIAVDRGYKRKGIGRKLLKAVENWAIETGAIGVRLTSGLSRKEAHKFYFSCGYDSKKDQKNFMKILI